MQIFDFSHWDAWKEKYLDSAALSGEWSLIVDDLGDNIYQLPLFTSAFCEEVIALAEFSDKWTTSRHENYPTNDVLLEDLGINFAYDTIVREIISPLCTHLWQLSGPKWKELESENFLAKYTPGGQTHLSLHHDYSHITMLVKLNNEYDGGGTWFPKYNKLVDPSRIGTATLHPGIITHRHGARQVYAGRRYVLVSFMRSE